MPQLSNRRKLFEDISLSEKGKVETVVTSVIMVDIDFFKVYNDSYGHQQGDKCLKEISACIKKFGEENDVSFYRYGGEEFIGLGYIHTYERWGKSAKNSGKVLNPLKYPLKNPPQGLFLSAKGMQK